MLDNAKYAVFDFDGTLAHSHFWLDINTRVLRSFGVETDFDEFNRI